LKGRFYANIFLHFEPHGHTERHNAKSEAEAAKAKREYLEALENPAPKLETSDLPDYIERGSEEEAKWRQDYIYQVEPVEKLVRFSPSYFLAFLMCHDSLASSFFTGC
jgi:hypothetical protein